MSAPDNWREDAEKLLTSGDLSAWEVEFLNSIRRRTILTARQAETLARIADAPDAAEIAEKLTARIEALAEQLVGESPTDSSRNAIRFYPKGGLVITTTGEKRGIWFDHGSGTGGDSLDLVRHLRGGSMGEAIAWAQEYLGTAPAPRAAPACVRPRKTDNIETARRIWQEATQ